MAAMTSGDDSATMKWLADAPAQSAHALAMIGAPTPPSDFQSALQAALDNSTVLSLNAPLTIDAPVAVKIKASFQGWAGLDGRFNRITSRVKDAPAIRFYMSDQDTKGVCARSLFVGNFSMIGGGAEACGLQIDVPFNDRWLVNPELRSLWFEGIGGTAGLVVLGSVFEGNLYGVGTMNCRGNGAYFGNAGEPGNVGIVSALRWFGGTQRQNGGHGLCVDAYDGPYDVRLFGLYFCENAGSGVNMLAGAEQIEGCGFENNHGGQGIYFANRARITHCSGSTWGPQTYLVRAFLANDCHLRVCGVEGYGGGQPKLGAFDGKGTVWLSGSGDGSNVERSGDVEVRREG